LSEPPLPPRVAGRREALFRREAIQASLDGAYDSTVLRVTPTSARVLFWLATTLLLSGIGAAFTFRADQKSIGRGALSVEGTGRAFYAESPGVVSEIVAQVGDSVKEGDVLLRVDANASIEKLAEQERAVALLRSTLSDVAQNFSTNSTQDSHSSILLRIERARLEGALLREESKLVELKSNSAGGTVRARAGGRLEKLLVEPGETVHLGMALGRIVSRAPPSAVVFLPERELAFLHVGDVARVDSEEIPSERGDGFPAHIMRIGDSFASEDLIASTVPGWKPESRVVRVDLAMDPSPELSQYSKLLRHGSPLVARFSLRKRPIISIIFDFAPESKR